MGLLPHTHWPAGTPGRVWEPPPLEACWRQWEEQKPQPAQGFRASCKHPVPRPIACGQTCFRHFSYSGSCSYLEPWVVPECWKQEEAGHNLAWFRQGCTERGGAQRGNRMLLGKVGESFMEKGALELGALQDG